ncbi:histidinol-phosphate aminotransferase [Granulicella pectinivorans]|uniref:Histidinol-phosphate aminotransferase n=1 Tax=Granulicella pectinivorans TaxID=474950 RepID=A0A1I6MDV8_9BACT|nr:histidinol-phosphate aminotransferase [Granulicella pectinivorans]
MAYLCKKGLAGTMGTLRNKEETLSSISRRSLLKQCGIAAAANLPVMSFAAPASHIPATIHVNLNENAFGPSPTVVPAITRELPRLARYATADLANEFTAQIAAYERVPPEQVVLGEILGGLGLYLGSQGAPGGEFLYSVPGYLALINAASHVGGVGVPVPLNSHFENDLPALREKVSPRTRAIYLINPHNPTGTASDPVAFRAFLEEASRQAPVIVDEAYLEYTRDFEARSAVSLVRDGANILVFRTFDKIHGLAGMPIGYTLAPAKLAAILRRNGLGDAEGLGRLNLVAAAAALNDQEHVGRVRDTVSRERAIWLQVLDELKLRHTRSETNFIFFDTGAPQANLAGSLGERGIEIARAFPPYDTWARITIGLPSENRRVRQALREIFSHR